MKLVTTYAALDLLGPAFVWSTPVYVDGPVRDGVLQGNLYLRGQGDPKLVVERLWLLLRRVQGAGIQQIQGDIVLDHSAFDVVPQDPAAFDGEALRPYNAAPDALLVNFKSLVMTFVPERGTGLAWVHVDPPLAGVALPVTVPAAGCCVENDGLDPDASAVAGTTSFALADDGQWLVSAEVKGRTEQFHLPQIARAAYALESAARASKSFLLDEIEGVIPLGLKVVGRSKFWVVEFEPVNDPNTPLVKVAEGVFELVPHVPGID